MYRSAVYGLAPLPIQELLIDCRSAIQDVLRTSRGYAKYVAEAAWTQWATPAQLEELRHSRLARLIDASRRGSTYYRELFERLGISSAHDFDRAPLLTKAEVRRHASEILSSTYRGLRFKGSTSGTSGAPLLLTKSLEESRHEAAYYHRQLEWAGYARGDRLAWFRGDQVVPESQATPPFWRHARVARTLFLSSYHLAAHTARAYLDALRSFRPQIIQAYPSSVGFLAQYLESTGRSIGIRLKGIVTSSETLRGEVRRMIEKRFETRVFDWYGSYERVAAIGTCEHGRYHLLSDYSIPELVPCAPGVMEIVGTSYVNEVFPLLRYASGDYVVSDNSDPCCCGRHFPVVSEIIGRSDDVVQTPSGRRIGRLDHVFKGVSGILEAQIVQTVLTHVKVLLVASETVSEQDRQLIIDRLASLTGRELTIDVECVPHIQRGARGKHQLVLSTV